MVRRACEPQAPVVLDRNFAGTRRLRARPGLPLLFSPAAKGVQADRAADKQTINDANDVVKSGL